MGAIDEFGMTPLAICTLTDSKNAAAALLRVGALFTLSGVPGDIDVQPVPVLGFCALNDAIGVASAMLEATANIEQRFPSDYCDGSRHESARFAARLKGLTPLQTAVTN